MIEEAKEELKRADHLIYVSLKYTKTVDVIASTILRLVDACQIGIDSLLRYLKQKNKIKEIPKSYKEKIELLKKTKTIEIAKEFAEFSEFLKRIQNSKHSKKEEFRKHVALIAEQDEIRIAEVDIEALKSYYNKTKEFINIISEIIGA